MFSEVSSRGDHFSSPYFNLLFWPPLVFASEFCTLATAFFLVYQMILSLFSKPILPTEEDISVTARNEYLSEEKVAAGSDALNGPTDERNRLEELVIVEKCDKLTNKQCKRVEFRWYGKANKVFLTGNFLRWTSMVQMMAVLDGFMICLDLPRGHHEFKFQVDNKWCLNKEYETCKTLTGVDANFVHNY